MHPTGNYWQMAEFETCETLFPLRSNTHESQLFPICFLKPEGCLSLAVQAEKSDAMRCSKYRRARNMRNIEKFSLPDNVKKFYEVDNLSWVQELPISNGISCQHRFPMSQIKINTKFPSRSNLSHVTSSEYMYDFKRELNSQIPCEENSAQFPMAQSHFVGAIPIMSYGDKRFFPIKTDIPFKEYAVPTNGENNNTLSSTMTQFNSFIHTNSNGKKLVEIHTKKQTNIENSEHEQKAQNQIMCVHNNNDDVLATEGSKNIHVSGQPKRCSERKDIGEHIQNSRSTSETHGSHKNMNDLENYHQLQQYNNGPQVNRTNPSSDISKTPSPSAPPKTRSIIAARKKMSAGITVQNKEQNFDSVCNHPQISRTNNLSDINFEHRQQSWAAYLTHLEVRDPSSQEDLLVDDRVVSETNIAHINIEPTPPHAAEPIYTDEATLTSTNNQLTSLNCPIQKSTASHTITATQYVQSGCLNFVSERVVPNAKSDVFAAGSDPLLHSAEEGTSTESRRARELNDFVRGANIAMTLTNVEEQKEEHNTYVALSYLDDNKNTFFDQEFLDEMKFEMNGAENASNAIPQSMRSNTQLRNERIQTATNDNSVLSAATDVSKLANFGKSRRENTLLSRSESSAYIDIKDSVLPARTLLRRQRRMHSQYLEDKKEDPVERLNRLRARISGALNEVKDVLKHYSTDEGGETEQGLREPNGSSLSMESHKLTTEQTTVKDEGPVSFRFVKKIRRRSVFNEEEIFEVKKDSKCDTTEANQTNNRENYGHVPKANINLEQEEIKFHDNVSRNKSQEFKNLDINNFPKIVLTSKENISKKVQENIESAEQCGIIKGMPNLKILERDNPVIEVDEVETQSCITKNVSMEIQLKAGELHIPNLSEKESKRPKKRITNSKANARRASIAAIEGSQIDPPVNIDISLAIKTQRRPSDSEAIVKRKIAPSIENKPIKNIRRIVKEKRPPVKTNATVSKVDINQPNYLTKNASTTTHLESSAITTVNVAPIQAIIETKVPITSDSLSIQLAAANEIGDTELDCVDKLNKTKSEVNQTSIWQKSWGSPTKLSDENGEMVAAIPNQLRTGEASSHTINAERQPLSILIDKSKETTTSTEKTNDQYIGEGHSRDSPVADVSNVKISKYTEHNTDPVELNGTKRCFKESNNSEALPSIEKVTSTPHLDTSTSLNSNTLCPTQTDTLSIRRNSPEEHITKGILNQNLEQSIAGAVEGGKMPEQQVTPTPVKPVQVYAENDAGEISVPKKKTIIKRIIRKNSIDKASENNKFVKDAGIETKRDEDNDRFQLSSSCAPEKSESNEVESVIDDEIKTVEESANESNIALVQPKKPRKVKKKVIIKRQQRKLSVGETSFFKESNQPDATPSDTEIFERAISYATDDEDESTTGQAVEPVRPIKSCMKQREFQVGDWVMYGERFRKTQIRWKKGQISERITSISYKIKIDDKEISAHISYIKKYTDRRVNFGGKEYLEIDYDQIAEEERRARTYSIWNMV